MQHGLYTVLVGVGQLLDSTRLAAVSIYFGSGCLCCNAVCCKLHAVSP